MEQKIIKALQKTGWDIAYENIDKVPEEEYQRIRQMGIGASDSSKLLNVNPFSLTPREDLIKEKVTGVFDESISKKASVRMGKDLEPLIIQKLNDPFFNWKVYKPKNMYKDTCGSGLTVNFDGVASFKNSRHLFPIEIKVVTKYGKKYYNFTKAILKQIDGEWTGPWNITPLKESPLTIEEKAHSYGIPVYYYTQLQQQIYALGSEYGYLAVLDSDLWDLNLFYVHRDEEVIKELIKEGTLATIKINALKNKTGE